MIESMSCVDGGRFQLIVMIKIKCLRFPVFTMIFALNDFMMLITIVYTID